MAGTFTAKVLANGQLPSTLGVIYTTPASTAAYVRRIHFYNDGAATQTVLLVVSSGTDRKQYKFQLLQDESADIDDHITLAAAETIKASTTTATQVDYVINGVEET